MDYHFDAVTDRYGTMSIKYDWIREKGMKEDVIPLWVADMDFPAPPAVVKSLQSAASHGIFGYSDADPSYYRAVQDWFLRCFDWRTRPEWIVKTPGVVFALACAVRACTKEGDAVLIQKPVYHPFESVILDNGRRVVNCPLSERNGLYRIDFDRFERRIIQEGVKLFLLCSPHNPVGRVWSEEELRRMADICLEHQVLIVSDEIHCDFVWKGHQHRVLASLDERYEKNTITATAPSKTFNIAGLQVSNIWIPDPVLREKFQKSVTATGSDLLNPMGLYACRAAYEAGEEWLSSLKEYLQGNIAFVKNYLEEQIPILHMREPEGTYLVWIDFRNLNLTAKHLEELLLNRARIWLSSGTAFGKEGEGFERMNIACPRSVLKTALDRLKEAVENV